MNEEVIKQKIKELAQEVNIQQKEEHLSLQLTVFNQLAEKLREVETIATTTEETITSTINILKPLRDGLSEANEDIRIGHFEMLDLFRQKSLAFARALDQLKEALARKRREFYKTHYERVLETFKELRQEIEKL